MPEFAPPPDLFFNRGPIEDPATYEPANRCASWLCLTGTEFAAMDGGISFAQVEAVAPVARNIVSDPPRVLDLDLARQHVAALDEIPRPTLVSCRMGPRSAAVIYMYSGLRAGAAPEDVIAAVERDDAPCASSDEYKTWIVDSMIALRDEESASGG
jgi:hypothetical protein